MRLWALVAVLTASSVGCVNSDDTRTPFTWPDVIAPVDTPPAVDITPDASGDTSADSADSLADTGDAVTPDVAPDAADADDADVITDTGPDAVAFTLPPEAAPIDGLLATPLRALAVLDVDTRLAATADAWLWLDPNGDTPIPDPDGYTTQAPAAAARLSDGSVVAVAPGLVAVVGPSGLVRSPITDAFDTATLRDVVATTADTLWFATATGLHRWRDGAVVTVAPTGTSTAGARLAYGATVNGTDALWVAADVGVYALVDTAGAPQAFVEQPDLIADAIAADDRGDLWVVADALLWRRTPDAVWDTVELPTAPIDVYATAQAKHVWVLDAEQAVYHFDGDLWTQVSSALAPAVTWGVDPAGSLLSAGDAGLQRLAAARVLWLQGVTDGATLAVPTTLTIRASASDQVASVEATVDGAMIPVTQVAEPATPHWQVILDAFTLDRGARQLSVRLVYGDDGAELVSSLSFVVFHTTWGDHVSQIYADRCSPCHNAVDGASTAVLTSSASWESRIDCIICRVTSPFDSTLAECLACDDNPSSMPPTGPIPGVEVDVIRAWRAGGFKE